MLSSRELVDLQADFAALLDLTCSIVRLSDVGGVLQPSTIATGVPLGLMSATEIPLRQYQSEELIGRQMALLSFPASQDVRVGDRVQVTGGQTYVVADLIPPVPNSNSAYRQCLAYYQTILTVQP